MPFKHPQKEHGHPEGKVLFETGSKVVRLGNDEVVKDAELVIIHVLINMFGD